MKTFHHINNVSVEVFPNPYFQQTRDLANGCFASYGREHPGRELCWDTPGGDAIAERYLCMAIREEIGALNDLDWIAEFEAIRRSIAGYEHGPLAFLYALAWDGGGYRPLGARFDWYERTAPTPRQSETA